MDAALSLYEKFGYEKASLRAVAETLGFSRINLYNYFSSKEALFLALSRREFEAIIDDMRSSLSELPRMDAGEFSAHWTNLMLRHGSALRLLALVHAGGFENCGEDFARFEKTLDETMRSLVPDVQRRFPALSRDDALRFSFYGLYAAAAMFAHTSAPSAGKAARRGDASFIKRYSDFVKVMLKGIGVQ